MGNYIVLEGNNVEVNAENHPVKTVNLTALNAGNNTLVAAVTGKKIRVISVVAFVESAGLITIQSGAGGTGLFSLGSVTIGTTFILPVNQFGWGETAAATLLNASVSGTTNSISLRYIEV